jgi:dTDP-4-dehydrorhamnose 3,5-epimerase
MVEAERFDDERGYFASFLVKEQFEAHGLDTRLAQCSISHNRRKGTLRGLHYQIPPHEQAKLVRCTRGALYDVLVDLRPASVTYRQWVAVELDAPGLRSLYVPPGLAHGFLTLQDETEVTYLISGPREPDAERGLRWDDPALSIDWPLKPSAISERDRGFPLLRCDRNACE